MTEGAVGKLGRDVVEDELDDDEDRVFDPGRRVDAEDEFLLLAVAVYERLLEPESDADDVEAEEFDDFEWDLCAAIEGRWDERISIMFSSSSSLSLDG